MRATHCFALWLIFFPALGQVFVPSDIVRSFGLRTAESVVSADFTADGKPDLLVLTGPGSVLLVTFDGANTPRPAPVPIPSESLCPSVPVFRTASRLQAADFNRDGKMDAAFHCETVWFLLLSSGTGEFEVKVYPKLRINRGVPYAGQLLAADFNGDGAPDIAWVSQEHTQLYFGTGQGGFAEPIRASPTLEGMFDVMVAVDFDGDGISEIAKLSRIQPWGPGPIPHRYEILIFWDGRDFLRMRETHSMFRGLLEPTCTPRISIVTFISTYWLPAGFSAGGSCRMPVCRAPRKAWL